MKQDDDSLPDHKREGWAERIYEQADMQRKAAKEEALIQPHKRAEDALLASWQSLLRSGRIADAKRSDKEQHEAAIKWAIETGAKP